MHQPPEPIDAPTDAPTIPRCQDCMHWCNEVNKDWFEEKYQKDSSTLKYACVKTTETLDER